MTSFENFLIDKGYIMFILNCKTMKYERATRHNISTMNNIDHRYFHNTDENVLKKIEEGIPVNDKRFTLADRKGEICFGLNEQCKPPTLIYPRPIIKIKKIINNKVVILDELLDDSMNIVFEKASHEEILKAMFDKWTVIEIDLTN